MVAHDLAEVGARVRLSLDALFDKLVLVKNGSKELFQCFLTQENCHVYRKFCFRF